MKWKVLAASVMLGLAATAQAAAEALLRSGAAAVDVWVLARTPEPDQEN